MISATDTIDAETCHDIVSVSTHKLDSCDRSATHASHEMRRSKSRVRSYFKKCKDAIIGTNTNSQSSESNEIASHEETKTSQATSLWYINEMGTIGKDKHDSSRDDAKISKETQTVENEDVTSNGEEALNTDEMNLTQDVTVSKAHFFFLFR